MIRPILLSLICFCSVITTAEQPKITLGQTAGKAYSNSALTSDGSAPFHLHATIVETTNPESAYKGEIDEQWLSSSKWRRVIRSPEFNQTIVVNGSAYYEKNKGEYYPSWLRHFVQAIFEPEALVQPLIHSEEAFSLPRGGNSTSCTRFQMHSGKPPAENSVFAVYCFAGNPIVLESVVTPGTGLEFKDYRGFEKKQIARRLISNPESGTTIEAKIEDLSRLSQANDALFAVPEETPQQSRLEPFRVQEAMAWSMLLDQPTIRWPKVRSGKTAGVLSIYVCSDRNGQVREAWPLNSDNAGLDDAVREQVMHWHFKPAAVAGRRVQMESVLSFYFNTAVDNPIPILSDAEARKLATGDLAPEIPPSLWGSVKQFRVHVSVNAAGELIGSGNPDNVSNALFLAGVNAVRQWKFRPYLHDGKPDNFEADIALHAH